jgi:hypothetical protein
MYLADRRHLVSKTGWILALILAATCVFLIAKNHNPHPPVIPGVTVRVDTVIVHDTIETVKTVTDFVVKRKPLPPAAIEIAKIDSGLPPPQSTAVDSTTCYSYSQEYANGAYAQAEMCSRYFPTVRPWDLSGTIKYCPGIDTMKTFWRVDTVPRIMYKPPIIPTWQAVTLGIAAGVLAGILVKK